MSQQVGRPEMFAPRLWLRPHIFGLKRVARSQAPFAAPIGFLLSKSIDDQADVAMHATTKDNKIFLPQISKSALIPLICLESMQCLKSIKSWLRLVLVRVTR